MKKSKILLCTLTMLLLSSSIVYADVNNVKNANNSNNANIVSQDEFYLQLDQSVFYPVNRNKDNKLPVVFMVHNGLEDKSVWGDFPKQIANAGFFTVNITWRAWDTTEVEAAIQYNLTKYADIIDTNKISFIGGCHGGKDVLQIMSHSGLNYKVTSAVVLSVAEPDQSVIDSEKVSHPPILAYYSKQDELGEYYQKASKQVAEDIITEPKKVIALDETAHGDNIVTKASNKEKVRNEIIAWIKSYNK